jgi:hypothetical protein
LIITDSTAMKIHHSIDKQAVYPPIESWVEVAVEPEIIWKIISTPGNLQAYHPVVEANLAESWDASKATDMLRYYSGLTLYRQVYQWLEGEGYDLVIGQSLETPNALVSWRIRSEELGRCLFKISLYLIKHQGGSGLKRSTRERFARYLDSIVKGIAHLAVTGEAVAEDQFGKVEGFSRP